MTSPRTASVTTTSSTRTTTATRTTCAAAAATTAAGSSSSAAGSTTTTTVAARRPSARRSPAAARCGHRARTSGRGPASRSSAAASASAAVPVRARAPDAMRRERSQPRPDWERRVVEQGLVFGTPATGPGGADRPYWDESVHYVFAMDEVLSLEADVEVLASMCLEAVDAVVTGERYREFAIPEWVWPAIGDSWRRRDP